mmetsp:Transcript_38602/g.122642  ORF Transcript_38602/g.122642 Transcript_38602/m.122642 type:complete len:1223 (-) Transcript_38602:64-3732(-)
MVNAGEVVVARTGRIIRLECENFKSYAGRQTIGPFKNFTAVIGPNGSGKSNLMDAISFVLGVKSSQLRGSALRDLVYSNDEDAMDVKRRAFVTCVYVTAGGEEMHFTRVISLEGTSSYKFNGRNCSWEDYNNKLQSQGILIKARNFLVFQGDVEAIAQKGTKELTALIEQISGSEELKADYEDLEAAKQRAEEKTSFNFAKKKGISAEKRQKKEQKEEAERHIGMVEELNELKVQYFLWQLFHSEDRIKTAEGDVAKLSAQLEEIARAQMGNESEVGEKKKQQAKLSKDAMLIEKKAAKKRAELEKNNPGTVTVKEQISRTTKRAKHNESQLVLKKEEHARQLEDIKKLQADLENVSAMLEEFEEAQKKTAKKKGKGLQMDDSTVAEYNQLKEKAGSASFKLKQERDALERAQQSDRETRSSLEDTVAELDSQLEALGGQVAEAKARKDRLARLLKDSQGELKELQAAKKEQEKTQRREASRREHLGQRLEEVEGQLREAKADRKEGQRERQQVEAVENMKRLLTGVHGRMTELVKVTQRKYNLALTVAMGRNMDAVITDDEKTAKECIRYLKEQRIAPMVFIPLQTIRLKPVDERLRQLGGSAKLIIDVLEYDRKLERAIVFACGNTLVTDTQEEAKRLAFSRSERHTVVAADGTLIQKSGLLSGGVTAQMEAKSSRWDEQAVAKLKEDRVEIHRELQAVGTARDAARALQETAVNIEGLEKKVELVGADLQVTSDKVARLEGEFKSITAEKKKGAPELAKVCAALAARQKDVDALQGKMNGVSDKIFSDFSKRVGVSNIREYEETNLRVAQESAEQRMQFSTQIASLQNQLEYEQRRDTKAPVDKLQHSIKDDKKLLGELRKQEQAAKDAEGVIEEELGGMTKEAQALRAQADEVDAEIKELKKATSGQNAEGAKLKRQQGALEGVLEETRAHVRDVLARCQVENVKLPVEGGGDAMEVDEDTDVGTSHLDFSALKRQYTATMRPPEFDKMDAEWRKDLETRTEQLMSCAPNLKALDQYEAIRDKESEAIDELEAAKKEARGATDSFQAKRAERYRLFMEAFTHISGVIDRIYKSLTVSESHPLGGTAYLSLENPDEPFLHGIKYTAMPPTKRFRDMEQLSGGEKTVAALALLFSVHSFRPSPFFVLDEVDAALDNQNVGKVANYIRNQSREGAEGNFQAIVISLKDTFFEKADALVGICRDADRNCSSSFTYDLAQHDR